VLGYAPPCAYAFRTERENEMPTTKKYWVKVIRPVIEHAVVEVEASSYQSALEEAAELAIDLDDSEWSPAPESDDYSVHPVAAYEQSDVEDEIDVLDMVTHRYALLEADLDAGQGRLLLQPWMESQSSLMVSDLASDWSEEVGALLAEGVEGFLQDLQEFQAEVAPDRGAEDLPSNVISFAKAQARRNAPRGGKDE
jgi:hypothetical protein